MPEAPEIKFLADDLKDNIVGQTFDNIISNTKTKVTLPKKSKVINVDTRGKLIIIQCKDYYVTLHMGLTGWLTYEEPKIYKYVLVFSNGNIYLRDQRRFSKIKVYKTEEALNKDLDQLGYDFIKDEIDEKTFIDILNSSKKNISSLLMDQHIFSGIGNYIRNEALYLSKINPESKSKDIDLKHKKLLYKKIKYVISSNLKELYDGKDHYKYRVYEREKDDKGNKIIVKIIAGRKTFYVPSIQIY
jgi:formamidopyrimidine-DNA glycosylase